jgi:PadR family transcriptional regulator, regulatory protein PadR
MLTRRTGRPSRRHGPAADQQAAPASRVVAEGDQSAALQASVSLGSPQSARPGSVQGRRRAGPLQHLRAHPPVPAPRTRHRHHALPPRRTRPALAADPRRPGPAAGAPAARHRRPHDRRRERAGQERPPPGHHPRKPTAREEKLAFYATTTARQIRITEPARATLRVLLAAGDQALHGLEISDRTGLANGTIYPLLARLSEAGWITSQREDHAAWLARNPPGQPQHPRRRNHQLTSHGRRAALRELARPEPIAWTIHEARAGGPGGTSRRGTPGPWPPVTTPAGSPRSATTSPPDHHDR